MADREQPSIEYLKPLHSPLPSEGGGIVRRTCDFQALLASMAEPDLETVLAQHTEAMGGPDAIERRRNVDVEVEIVEAAFSGTVRYRASREGFVQVDLSIESELVFSEGIDADGPWQADRDLHVRPIGNDGAAALAQGIELNLFGLHEYSARGHDLRLGESIRMDGIDFIVLEATFSTGAATRLLLDPGTWLVGRRRERRALHPEIAPDERSLETRVEAFEPLCGVPWPVESRQVDVETGEVLQQSRTLRRECNRSALELKMKRPG